MEGKKGNFLPHILNILSILVIFSSVFYFAGFLYTGAYYSFTGLGLYHFTYLSNYSQTVVTGLLQYIFLIPIITFILAKLYLIWTYRSYRRQLEKYMPDLLSLKAKLLSEKDVQVKKMDLKEIEELEQKAKAAIENNKKDENELIEKWISWPSKLFFFGYYVLGIIINVSIVEIFYRQTPLYLLLASAAISGLGILFSYLIYKDLYSILEGKMSGIYRAISTFPLLFLLLLAGIPLLNGLINSKTNLYNGSFKKVVVSEENRSYSATYIYSNNNEYIFLTDEKIIVIPNLEIKRIEIQSNNL